MLEEIDQTSFSVYTVSDLNAYIRALLESNENLMDIWVSGEVSNLSQPRSGHMYFTLKDANAQVRCVIWRNHAMRLGGALRDGMQVEAHGAVNVYESGGQYQLNVDGIRAGGEGFLYQEFVRLKAALEAEGLFDPERKLPIPALPGVIGVVTSATGAALQDILNTLKGRYPLAEVVVSPASVQGDAAPAQLVFALEKLNQFVRPDVILLGRGGGSLEDLWAFNDERVVRAVIQSAAPVIAGVGHETDFTLTDFAADLRAPTPTGAAVAAVPDMTEIIEMVNGYRGALATQIEGYFSGLAATLEAARMKHSYLSPAGTIRQRMQMLDQQAMALRHFQERFFTQRNRELEIMAERLASFDPRAVLKRGFAIISDLEGKIISSIEQVKLGQEIQTRLIDGTINAQVNGKQAIEEMRNDKEK
jgi:exodeoxyribonuclease VII large subunit